MYFKEMKSILYSDTLIPDIFISEYLPSLSCEAVKIYIYCLHLSKHNKKNTIADISKKLDLEYDVVSNAISHMENLGILERTEKNIILIDLKEKEINRIYRLKETSSPEEAIFSSDRNKRRAEIISAINKNFFQGLMSPSWYTNIDAWFDKYKFDEDVMYALFQHCYDHKGLSPAYITKVGDNWYSKNIINGLDLDKYFIQYQKVKDIRLKISRKLKLNRFLTEYEELFVENWVLDYKYGFDIIEFALRKTTSKTNPNFNYINSIIKDWFENGLVTKDEIIKYDSQRRASFAGQSRAAGRANFEQREYSEGGFDDFFSNVEK